MDYKTKIVKMIEKIENTKYLETIYYFVKKLVQ